MAESIFRGEKKVFTHERERIHSLAHATKMLALRLNAEYLELPDFEPALTEARACVAQLEGWINEIDWIAQNEMQR